MGTKTEIQWTDHAFNPLEGPPGNLARLRPLLRTRTVTDWACWASWPTRSCCGPPLDRVGGKDQDDPSGLGASWLGTQLEEVDMRGNPSPARVTGPRALEVLTRVGGAPGPDTNRRLALTRVSVCQRGALGSNSS
jgi:hypothetical protein